MAQTKTLPNMEEFSKSPIRDPATCTANASPECGIACPDNGGLLKEKGYEIQPLSASISETPPILEGKGYIVRPLPKRVVPLVDETMTSDDGTATGNAILEEKGYAIRAVSTAPLSGKKGENDDLIQQEKGHMIYPLALTQPVAVGKASISSSSSSSFSSSETAMEGEKGYGIRPLPLTQARPG